MAHAHQPDFGIYIHWPFCAAKCPYCDFNSHVRRGGPDDARLLAAYLAELDHYAGLTPGRTVGSVFFGGGTPSLMAPGLVGAILDHVAVLWSVSPAAEITLEANPSSVEAGRFRGYRSAGVNRVSLGVQSLRDDALRRLGRLHNAAEAVAAVETAKRHFPRLSFDLIYARPGQSAADWRRELSEALIRAAGHLSLYQLTIEPGTAFYALEQAGRLRIPDGPEAAALYELTQELCQAAGLPAYEISNHAVPGDESRHNLLYWRYGDYAGVGPGAHGRLLVAGGRLALSTRRDPAAWVAQVERYGHGLVEREKLSPLAQAEEMLLMGLRLAEGLNLARLAAASGHGLSLQVVAALRDAGLVEMRGGGRILAAKPAGRLVLNAVIEALASGLMSLNQNCAGLPKALGAGSIT